VISIDHEISPSQAHTLEMEVGCEVMDRQHGHPRNLSPARELALRARAGTRSRAWATWRPRLRRSRQGGRPKDRGAAHRRTRGGESHGELDRRKIRDGIAELQEELDGMASSRKRSAPAAERGARPRGARRIHECGQSTRCAR